MAKNERVKAVEATVDAVNVALARALESIRRAQAVRQ